MRVILLLCCFVFPSNLAADVFIYQATGVIDSVIEEGGTDADGLVVPGERFTMRFTLDTNESLGQFDDLGPYNQTKHYIQSYPISVQFSGGFSFVATPPPPGAPWRRPPHGQRASFPDYRWGHRRSRHRNARKVTRDRWIDNRASSWCAHPEWR